ncbi:MAG: hypothetical protein WCY86_01450 [Spirosomataceae bacterium]
MLDVNLMGKYFAVAIASTLKYLGGTFTGLALGLHWIETAICSTIGMMMTVVVINYAGTLLRDLLSRIRRKKPRKFTRFNRLAVKVWRIFGTKGIALLTPALFTPPLGSALLVAFRAPRVGSFLWMLISGLIWGIIFTLLVYRLEFLRNWLG